MINASLDISKLSKDFLTGGTILIKDLAHFQHASK
jgi:hypothetical protein